MTPQRANHPRQLYMVTHSQHRWPDHGRRWFPSFKVEPKASADLGFLEYNGRFVGSREYRLAPISELDSNDALRGGVLAIFSESCTVIMSPASSFMSSSYQYRTDLQELGFGIMGSVTKIPRGHRMSTILSSFPNIGPDGIRKAFSSWGNKLQTIHGTRRPSDVTLDFLQYSTDNGAFYYYVSQAELLLMLGGTAS